MFSLLLASLLCGIPIIADVPALAFVPADAGVLAVAGVLALASISADANDPILAGVLTYCTVQCIVHCTMRNIRLSNCQTMAIVLLFFSAIGLLKYQISEWRIIEIIGLSDQALNISDYRISDSKKIFDCPAMKINNYYMNLQGLWHECLERAI
jgi:hypothetical protein